MATATDCFKREFERYARNKLKYQTLRKETATVTKQLQDQLSDIASNEKFTQNLKGLLDDDDAAIEKSFQHDPFVMVVGQSKSGKSSLINAILGSRVVQTDSQPCTARVTQIEFAPDGTQPLLILRKHNGDIVEEMPLARNVVPNEYVNLPVEDRENPDKIDTMVEARIRNEILSSGLKILDTPGYDENDHLNELVLRHVDSILPVIIYVINGKNFVTREDVRNINLILSVVQPEDVFFVANKTETEPESSDEDTADDVMLDNILRAEMTTMTTIYRQLCDNGFLNPSVKMEDCDRFHCLSTFMIRRHRRKQSHVPARYIEAFERFKACLVTFTSRCLGYHAEEAGLTLARKHRLCIDVLTDQANKIFKIKGEYMNAIDDIRKKENSIYKSMIKKVGEEEKLMVKAIGELLENVKGSVSKEAKNHVYKAYKRTILKKHASHDPGAENRMEQMVVNIREDDEDVDDSDVNECQKQIRELAKARLNRCLMAMVQYSFLKEDGYIEKLMKQVETLSLTDSLKNIEGVAVLKDMMISAYRFCIEKKHFKMTVFRLILREFRSIIRALTSLFKGPHGPARVNTPEWKAHVAIGVVNELRCERVAAAAMKTLEKHITRGHKNFCERLKYTEDVYREQVKIGEKSKPKLRLYNRNLACMELRALSIGDEYKFGDTVKGGRLRSTAGGTLYEVMNNEGQREPLVVKVVIAAYPGQKYEFDPVELLALQVHCIRYYDHEAVLKLRGCIIEDEERDDGECKLLMYYPRMKGALLDHIAEFPIAEERMKMALQLARGIEYLHGNDVVHRNIKPTNILIDYDGSVKLSGLGLSLPVGLTANDPTPIHVAPEMLGSFPRSSRSNIPDAKAMDLYAFGICFWYIVDGRGVHPQYVVTDSLNHAVFDPGVATVSTGLERRPGFKDAEWDLMTECWNADPEKRPSIENVCDKIQAILKTYS